jgi:mono/diheme cytochrome c family protein
MRPDAWFLLSVAVTVAFVLVANGEARAQMRRTPITAGVYSEVQAKRGEQLYAENCRPCHAGDLSGTELAPALTLAALGGGRERSLADVFDVMQVTMPLNSPGGLSAQQNADILAFILQRGNAPAGATELPPRRDTLEPMILPR